METNIGVKRNVFKNFGRYVNFVVLPSWLIKFIVQNSQNKFSFIP